MYICSVQLCVCTHTHTHLRTSVQGRYTTRSWIFVQLLFTTFLHGYFDSRFPRPIDGNKRRFPRRPVSRMLSLEPELFTVDSSRRPSREARARAQAPRARGTCNFQNSKFQINSDVSPLYALIQQLYRDSATKFSTKC
jgi:hypothetical protein